MKRLKIIEDKNEQQLLAIKSQGKKQSEIIKDRKEEQLDAISNQEGITIDDKKCVKCKSIFETIAEVSKSKNAKEEAEKLEKINKLINYRSITEKNAKEIIGIAKYMNLDAFSTKMFYGSISLEKAEEMQDKMELEIEN